MNNMKSIVTEAGKIWQELTKNATVKELNFELEIHKKLLNIFQVGDYYYMIFNIPETKFDIISDEMAEVLGYEKSELTVPFFISSIHPDDQPWFLNFENKVVEFFTSLRPEQVRNYKVRYDYRIRKKNGDYIRVMQQVLTLQFEGDNQVVRTLVVHTDISHIKQDGLPVLSFIGLNGEPSYINVDVKEVFTTAKEIITKREREILNLLVKGNDSKTIASLLSISKQTVDTHRKNILKKTGCENTAALIATALKNGWV